MSKCQVSLGLGARFPPATPSHKRHSLALAGILVFVWAVHLVDTAAAGNGATHTVTVRLNPINEMRITDANLVLNLNATITGSNPGHLLAPATCVLNWATDDPGRKITVESGLESPNLTLTAAAQSVSGGTPAPEVTLSTTPVDLITDMSKAAGRCLLKFTARPTSREPTPTCCIHTVVLTLTAA